MILEKVFESPFYGTNDLLQSVQQKKQGGSLMFWIGCIILLPFMVLAELLKMNK